MRLVDADSIRFKPYYDEYVDYDGYINDLKTWQLDDILSDRVDNTPTVKAIPIDKPFLKMRYGDYVVYDKEWLVNHLQTEWNILQGKEYQPSIPIEFIERKLAEHWYVDYDIRELLDDWEKENADTD